MKTSLRIEPDSWLTSVMDREVFRVTLPAAGAQGSGELLSSKNTSFLYAKVPTANVQAVLDLAEKEFYVVDTQVTLERKAEASARVAVPGLTLREAEPADADAVTRIAGNCFRYSRFHLDPRVPAELAHRIKRDWIANYFLKKRGDKMLIALLKDHIVGFLSVLVSKKGPTWTIDLVGVDSGHQGQGIGRALVQRFLAWPGDTETTMRVGTQIANIPSLRLYERLGFTVVETAYVLHAHYERAA